MRSHNRVFLVGLNFVIYHVTYGNVNMYRFYLDFCTGEAHDPDYTYADTSDICLIIQCHLSRQMECLLAVVLELSNLGRVQRK